jgi:hypothetical protein
LLELNPAGKIIKEIKLLPDSIDGGHSYMRNARKLENGNYLVAHYGLDKVCEYDSLGKLVMEIPVTGGPTLSSAYHRVIHQSLVPTIMANLELLKWIKAERLYSNYQKMNFPV